MYTLVIINMQYLFTELRNKRVISTIRKEILMAKKSKAAIVFVEYSNSGSLSSLKKLTTNYNRVYTALKKEDNGSYAVEIDNIISHYKLSNDLRICCGIIEQQDMLKTVKELNDHRYESAIIKKGCDMRSKKGPLDFNMFLPYTSIVELTSY